MFIEKRSTLVYLLLLSVLLYQTYSTAQPINLQIIQGYSGDAPILNYYQPYQRLYLSDLNSTTDYHNYHFCTVNRLEASKTVVRANFSFNQQLVQEHVVFDLNQVINMQQIVDYQVAQNGTMLYVMFHDSFKAFNIQINNTIRNVYSLQFPDSSNTGNIIITPQNRVFTIKNNIISEVTIQAKKSYFLKQVYKLASVQNSTQALTFTSASILNNSLYLALSNNKILEWNLTANTFDSNSAGSLSYSLNIQQKSLKNMHISPDLQFILIPSEKQGVLITFDVNFIKQTIQSQTKSSVFYHIDVLGESCHQIVQILNQIYVACLNTIYYFNKTQLTICQNQPDKQLCFNNINLKVVNTGYRIKQIQQFDNQTLIIRGYDQYEIYSIVYETSNNVTQVRELKRGASFKLKTDIYSLAMLSIRSILLISKTQLLLVDQLPTVSQVSCHTTNQNTLQFLNLPIGKFNSRLKIQGLCSKFNSTISPWHNINIQGTNLCTYQVMVNVELIHQTQNFVYVWYVLIAIIACGVIFILVYFFVQKRTLKLKYEKFVDQDEKGRHLAQNTIVTQPNQSFTMNQASFT